MAEPTRTGESGRREPLSRARIVEAAAAIIDAEGVDALSMRRLGGSLGVEAMAVYHHFPNKDAVLDGVAGTLIPPAPAAAKKGDWESILTGAARDLRAGAARHPGAALLLVSRPLAAGETGEWASAMTTTLISEGFSESDATDLVRATLAYALGWMALTASGTVAGAPEGGTSALSDPGPGWDRGFDEGLASLLSTWARRLPPGSPGAKSATSPSAAAEGGSPWIVQVGDEGGKKKPGKKKGKGKKKKA